MSVSASQCSKGSESGWTVYLDESWSHSPEEWLSSDGKDYFYGGRTKVEGEGEEGEGENLSMVSDASSGPPFHQVEDDCSNESFSSGKSRNKSKKAGESCKREQHLNYYYRDTACSTHPKCTEQEKTGSRCFHYGNNSAPAEKANFGKKGGLKNRKG